MYSKNAQPVSRFNAPGGALVRTPQEPRKPPMMSSDCAMCLACLAFDWTAFVEWGCAKKLRAAVGRITLPRYNYVSSCA